MLERPIVCSICKTIFATKANKDRHFKKIHGIDPSVGNIVTITNNNIDTEDDKIVDKKDKYEKDLDLLKMVYELKHENTILKLEKDNITLKKDNQIQKEQFEKELYKQKSEIHEKDKIFAQDVARSTLKTTDTAVNGLTYAKKNYPNAPNLKKLDKYEFEEDDGELVKLLIFYSNKGSLSHYIGDFLIKFYKKNDPNDQSLWATDNARLTFIIKQILKKKSDWHYDKKGIKVCNTIVNPLLNNIKTILRKYNDTLHGKINGAQIYESDSDEEYESQSDYDRHKHRRYDLDNNDKMKLVNEQKDVVQIITDIDNKILSKEIIKYISPLLSLAITNNCDKI